MIHIDPNKKKSVLYLEAMNDISLALSTVKYAIDELKQTIANKPNDLTGQSIVLALQPLSNLAEKSAPFLKEILSNEFVSALASKNTELEKKVSELETELKGLRQRQDETPVRLTSGFAAPLREVDGAENPL